MNKRKVILVAAICLIAGLAAKPYTFNTSGGHRDHWASTPTYQINETPPGSNISGTSIRSVASVINSAFNTWSTAPNASLIANQGQQAPASTGLSSTDGINLICFTCTGDFSQDASTLAFTATSTETTTGNIVDADILFNPKKAFTTDATVSGQSGQDLETVAVHEIGHFFGFSHSGVVKATMFPFAPPVERTLGYDDVMIASQVYPNPGAVSTHTISGTVRLSGNPVFGAQVVAESQTNFEPNGMMSANVRKTPISALTLPDGTYSIVVPDDTYFVFAEPLDDPMSNGDIPDYAKSFTGKTTVQTNFTTRYH
jgi:hypothetical protein